MTREEDAGRAGTCPRCGAPLAAPGEACARCARAAETQLLDAVSDVGPPADPEREEVAAALAPDYEIVDELGRGGMAVVYRAREVALERDVAIKVLPLSRTGDAGLVERFEREAKIAASLEHPHIVPIHRVGRSGRVSFIAMKYVRGPSLEEVLAREGALRPADVRRLLAEVGDALGHAHRRGFVHRDIKPANVMRDAEGRFVVMDFGIARTVAGDRLTEAGGSIGTPTYMSPEQARAQDVDGRSDLYSLGVVAYECLCGRPPFTADDPMAVLLAHVSDPVPEPALDSGEARAVYAVVRRLLEKDPARRPADPEGLAVALDRPAGGAAAPPSAPAAARVPDSQDAGAAPAPARSAAGVLRSLRARFDGLPERARRAVAAVGAVAVLALSVLVLRNPAAARCRAALPDAGPDDRGVLVEPLGTVASGAPLPLSFTVCGVPDGTPFTVRLTVRPADEGLVGGVRRFLGGGDPVRLSWDDESEGFATERTRAVDVGALAPASYRVEVEVRDQEGREADAGVDFLLVES